MDAFDVLDGWLKLEAEAGRRAVRLRLGLRLERGLCLGLGQRAPLQIWDFGVCPRFGRGLGCDLGLGQAGMRLKRRGEAWRVGLGLG